MNLTLFHLESTSPLREIAQSVTRRIVRALRAARRLSVELAVIAVLAVAAMAIKLAAIAVSNTTVADALANGALFF